jgi:hypothetical protein
VRAFDRDDRIAPALPRPARSLGRRGPTRPGGIVSPMWSRLAGGLSPMATEHTARGCARMTRGGRPRTPYRRPGGARASSRFRSGCRPGRSRTGPGQPDRRAQPNWAWFPVAIDGRSTCSGTTGRRRDDHLDRNGCSNVIGPGMGRGSTTSRARRSPPTPDFPCEASEALSDRTCRRAPASHPRPRSSWPPRGRSWTRLPPQPWIGCTLPGSASAPRTGTSACVQA